MEDSEDTTSVCSSTMARFQGKTVRLLGRIIQPGQPGANSKVQVYGGPGNPIAVTLTLDSRIENLVEFIGTVTSSTSMRADSYYELPSDITEGFDLETYYDVLKYTTVVDNPWSEGLYE